MRTVLSIIAIAALVFTFGIAYAGNMPHSAKNAGTWDILFSRTESVDLPDPYRELGFETVASAEMKGAAAGGIREDVLDRSGETWNVLFGRTESVDLPDPYSGFEIGKAGGMKGVAPGGIRAGGEGGLLHEYSIIDTLSPTGVSKDLP